MYAMATLITLFVAGGGALHAIFWAQTLRREQKTAQAWAVILLALGLLPLAVYLVLRPY
ncbi:MAG: hypothetical protein BLITH_0661 [Brockia lithotrophica]|uniref:Uncharacterized protein n=1 Tax=Brockia lithotrophica TaxID=933949 RepID=A0A2T5G8G4_9BACL|nr:hypothetical protein [Brockia lithotrophica]MBT9252509.1 hypothetical protein [Brockia lithotrophica]MBT9252825.1 hypothetical protein [Brockia lithotrophica]PTQ52482.1 MAG: hypothetical protein BLITH_0661 [Brockia lithotrophica]